MEFILCLQKYGYVHGDIKTDNILIKGLNDKDAFIIQRYKEENFFGKYSQTKKDFWVSLGEDLKQIDNMKKEDKINRCKVFIQQEFPTTVWPTFTNRQAL